MIQKIQASEYLKRLDNMTAEEKDNYTKRVGEWSKKQLPLLTPKMEEESARFLNVIQCSASWNDEECRAWTDGARLLTALVHTGETWLPDMLYVKSAKRAIRQMISIIKNEELRVKKDTGAQSQRMVTGAAKDSGYGRPAKEERAEGTSKATHAVAPFQENAGDGNIAGGNNEGEGKKMSEVRGKTEEASSIIPRPTHIDQYVHLLPKKTQEHAALVQGLYRELEDARQKMQLLMDDPTASPKDREAWAKKATKCDNTLRKIFDELDSEWEKLVKSGRVVVDDLGNARVVPIDNGQLTIDNESGATQEQEPAELTSEQRARRRELRKWLTDTRRGNGAARDERVKQWKVNFKEYLTLEGDKAFEDEKILEAAKHYEIDIKKLK